MVTDLQKVAVNGDKVIMPRNEGQARELLEVPPEKRLQVLRLAAANNARGTLSGRLIR